MARVTNGRKVVLLIATLIDHVGRLDVEELDRLEAAIDARRHELAGRGALAPMSIILEQRPHGSGVLQLERRDGSGPDWYFYIPRDGKRRTIYIGRTDDPEITLAELMTEISG